jgi:hypothetical protein
MIFKNKYKIYILLFGLLAFKSVFANTITLTCDFRYSNYDGITMEVPANCTKNAIKALGDKRPRQLSREVYMSATSVYCPSQYGHYKIYQGGLVATDIVYHLSYPVSKSEYVFYYQTRKICIASQNKK